MRKPLRVYADTSVFGGVYDTEFAVPSQIFFEQVQEGHFLLITSVLVDIELRDAPPSVQNLFAKMLPHMEIASVNANTIALQNAYLQAGILTAKWAADALHVATATVAGAGILISWNFRHIVHYDKIRYYNAINRLQGWDEIEIFSPREVIFYETEDENQ